MISSHTRRLPKIVIVGRPNVGKSTLFNRLLHKRRAITDPTPGVTRDPIETECMVLDRKVLLVDTGGFTTEKGDIASKVAKKSFETLTGADLILLLIELSGLTPLDEEFIGRLMPFRDKTLLVVNKMDGWEKEQEIWNYLSYGFKDVIGVSAAHGLNVDRLKERIVEHVGSCESTDAESEPAPDVRLAILGKPNVGKSTLVNRLTGADMSIVSDIPGTTRDVLEGFFTYKNKRLKVMDTAGIRRKRSVTEDLEYYSVNRAIKSIDEADVVLLLIDSEESVTEQDKKIAAQVVKRGKGIMLVLNKWDKMEDVPNRFAAVEDRVRFLFPALDFAPIVAVSARDGIGIDRLLDKVLAVRRQLDHRVDTGKLNRAIESWVDHYQPPMVQRRHYRVTYGTQVETNPVRFVFFVNRTLGFPAAYAEYLKNRIRKDLGFSMIPFMLELKERA